MSLVSVYNAEWRKRKINLFAVIRSFVSQLSPGQELTKVSLPSELCHPFSMLELVAYRELQLFHLLFDIQNYQDPLERFLSVVRWYLGLVREETMEKKPFNPVIGETHVCWVHHPSGDLSEFIGEQVSHHPPVSAFVVRNKARNLSIFGAVTFKVGFGSNCASVTTGGEVTIDTGSEKYTMSKCVPDMMVNNVIWGDKYLMWHGKVTITSADHEFVANFDFSEVDARNILEGEILRGGKRLFLIEGYAGHKSFITEVTEPGFADKKLFVDISSYTDNQIVYLPEEVQDEFNSLKLWMPVKRAIVKNDMATADEQKKKIEADQRIRTKQRLLDGSWKETKHFTFKPRPTNHQTANQEKVENTTDHHYISPHEEEEIARGVWEFKNNFSIDEEFITSTLQKAEQIRAEIGEKPVEQPQEPVEDNGACSLQ